MLRVVSNEDSWPSESDTAIPPSELTWMPKTPMADWLQAGRLSRPGVDEFDLSREQETKKDGLALVNS
ncbi:MAG: hypothetical protein WA996_11655 [Candidatus Promineifilaceae bacterium]